LSIGKRVQACECGEQRLHVRRIAVMSDESFNPLLRGVGFPAGPLK
jgi:hypothetical protein